MADLTIPSGAGALTPAVQPARTDAARAAQRAFFNQALTGVQAAAPVRTQPQATAAPAPQIRPTVDTSSAEPPSRMLRPGSLLDIKV